MQLSTFPSLSESNPAATNLAGVPGLAPMTARADSTGITGIPGPTFGVLFSAALIGGGPMSAVEPGSARASLAASTGLPSLLPERAVSVAILCPCAGQPEIPASADAAPIASEGCGDAENNAMQKIGEAVDGELNTVRPPVHGLIEAMAALFIPSVQMNLIAAPAAAEPEAADAEVDFSTGERGTAGSAFLPDVGKPAIPHVMTSDAPILVGSNSADPDQPRLRIADAPGALEEIPSMEMPTILAKETVLWHPENAPRFPSDVPVSPVEGSLTEELGVAHREVQLGKISSGGPIETTDAMHTRDALTVATTDSSGMAENNGNPVSQAASRMFGEAAILAHSRNAATVSARPIHSLRSGSAKVAADSAMLPGDRIFSDMSLAKSFLTTEEPRVTATAQELGTDVAKSAATMPAVPFRDHESSPPPPTNGDAVMAHLVRETREIAPPPAASAEPVSTAHRAVEVVLHAAERVSSREQQSVNLQFSVGGEELSVRVELRANAVHATFRTDSAELRGVLAQEWQSAASASDRPARTVTPVFTSSDASGGSNSAGDSAHQHRDRQPHRSSDAMDILTSWAAGRRENESRAQAPAVAAAPVSTRAKSRHLRTLA